MFLSQILTTPGLLQGIKKILFLATTKVVESGTEVANLHLLQTRADDDYSLRYI